MADNVTALIHQLKAAEVGRRSEAAEALLQMGEEAQAAALALVRACADPAEEVREPATGALESLGPPASSDMRGLMEMLGDANADVAYWAATLLGRLGGDAVDAVPELVKLLTKDGPLPGRERAAWALGQIGPAARDAVAALEAAAKLPSPRLARLAQESLDQIHS